MKNYLVSAIITTYNRKFVDIYRSINSVIKQNYKNIELILVDDNLKESPARIDIESNISKLDGLINYKYIKHEINMGAQQARNTGIKNASGELLAFLDDDDEWMENKISKQVEKYQDGVGLIFTKGYLIEEETNKKQEYFTTPYFKEEFTFKDLLYSDRIGTTTQAMIPKKVLEDVGYFDLNQQARQDYEMWLRISKKYRCVGVDDFLYNHYIHKGEQISKNINKSISGYNNIYKKYLNDFKKNPLAREHLFYRQFKNYKKAKKYSLAFIYLLKLIIYAPSAIIDKLFNK